MVKIGTVYKSEGNVDISRLTLTQRIGIFVNHMIDHSSILSGNKSKFLALREETERKRIALYTTSFLYHLERGPLKNKPRIPFTYDKDDDRLVRLALGAPQFFGYRKIFPQLERNLVEIKAYSDYVVIIEKEFS